MYEYTDLLERYLTAIIDYENRNKSSRYEHTWAARACEARRITLDSFVEDLIKARNENHI